MSDQNAEIKIIIKAISGGFGEPLQGLEKMRQAMMTNAALARQQFQEETQFYKLLESQTQATIAAMRQVEQEQANEAASAAKARLAQQQGAIKFTSDMEAQRLRELTQAQTEATNANQHAIDVRRGLLGFGLDKLAQLEGKSFEDATTFISANTAALGELGIALTVVIAAATATLIAFKKAFDLGQEGAQLQRLQDSGEALAKSFGVNLTEAARAIKAASLDTITTQQAMLETNRALLLGVAGDTETLANLMQVAALRGRALGLDTTEAFDRIVLGIGRLSTRVLDDIGIVIDGQKAYEDYATSIGKSVDELTDQQKRLALTNAILQDGNNLLKATGGLVDDEASAYSRLTTHVDDATNAFKKHFSEAILPIIKGLDDGIFATQKMADVVSTEAGVLKGITSDYKQYSDVLDGTAKAAGFLFNADGDLIERQYRLQGPLDTLILSHVKLTEGEYNASRATKDLDDSFFRMKDAAEAAKKQAAELAQSLTDLKDKMNSVVETSDKLSFADAAKTAIEFAQATGRSQASIDALALQLGQTDLAFVKYREAMKKAAEDGVISAEEVRKAWAPIGFSNLLTLHAKLDLDLGDAKQKLIDQIAQLDRDFANQATKDRLDLARKLADIDTDLAQRLSDLQDSVNDKALNIKHDHNKKLESIEADHQREIHRIMQRYELARLHALMDLSGKELFEAEAQRDADLANADDAAKQKKDDEKDNYDQALKDLTDYEQKQKDQIARDEERKRQDAKLAFERQRQDAKTAYDQKKADDQANFDKTKTQIITAYGAQRDAILKQLGLISQDNRKKLNERTQDFLDFVAANDAILKALAAGTMTVDQVRNQFLKTGGINFGGVPFVTPPPVQHNCPPGCHWSVADQECQTVGGNPCGGVGAPSPDKVSGPSTPQPGTPTNIKITLDVKGDGMLAKAVRDAALGAIWDVFKE